MNIVSQVAAQQTNVGTESPETKEAPVTAEIRQIGNFSCVIVKETFSFRATKSENRQQGIEYEEVKDEKDPTAPTLYRRKPETVELAYPLLSNFGIPAEFDAEKVSYADKTLNYVFSLLQQAVAAEAKTFIDEGKSFALTDLALDEIAGREPTKRGGRRSEIDQTVLEASIKAFADWMAAQGKSKAAIGLHVQVFKTRLRGTANWQPAILAKLGANLENWFASLAVGEEQDQHKDAYEFLSAKITAVLDAQPDLAALD